MEPKHLFHEVDCDTYVAFIWFKSNLTLYNIEVTREEIFIPQFIGPVNFLSGENEDSVYSVTISP